MATETLGAGVTSFISTGVQVTNGYAALTIVAWIKSDVTTSDRGFLYTRAAGLVAGNDDTVSMRYDAAGASGGGTNVIKAGIDSTSKVNNALESASGVQTTALQNLIMDWEAGDRERLYIDGVETTPTNTPPAHTGVTINADDLWLHRGGKDNVNSWDGTIYELRIYSRKLAAAERQNIVTQRGQDTIRNGLILHWHGDQGAPGAAVSSVTDRSGNGYTGTAGGTATPTFAEDLIHTRRRRAA
jgi:hypothetical protein